MMTGVSTKGSDALALERRSGVVAVALSHGRRRGVRLMTGDKRGFGLSESHAIVHVPFSARDDLDVRSITCGVALQCAPSKDRLAAHARTLRAFSPREVAAITWIEGRVALGWATATWPGLEPHFARLLPDVSALDAGLDAEAIVRQAFELARSSEVISVPPLLGRPALADAHIGVTASLRRMIGRLPWSTRKESPRKHSTIPVGGDGSVVNRNLPPPLRPEDDDPEVRRDERIGIPYPEWDCTRQRFRPDHVAVLERPFRSRSATTSTPVPPEVRRWFAEQTYRSLVSGLEDGSELDVDRYVAHHVAVRCGETPQPRVFRELRPSARDVCTALLLDASSSLGAGAGAAFRLELACADALSQAMSQSRERHGIFTFSGNTRHRVDVTCLKDFDERRLVAPSAQDLVSGGYTRLGAPMRHLTSRLGRQPAHRRVLLVLGDGMVSDEGYEGRYAWADVAHAVREAEEVGVIPFYLGVGHARVDPLVEMFGPKRSLRIRNVHELPRVLAGVHRQLVAA